MTLTYLTDDEKSSALKQVATNGLMVHHLVQNVVASSTYPLVISFPYKIHVLGMRVDATAAPATTDVTLSLTDGTTAITITMAAASTYKYETEDQEYAANSQLTLSNSTLDASCTADIFFGLDYYIDERRTI